MKKLFTIILLTLTLNGRGEVPEACNPYVAQCNKVLAAYKHETQVLRDSLVQCKAERSSCVELLKKSSSGGFLGVPSEAWVGVGFVSGFVVGLLVGRK